MATHGHAAGGGSHPRTRGGGLSHPRTRDTGGGRAGAAPGRGAGQALGGGPPEQLQFPLPLSCRLATAPPREKGRGPVCQSMVPRLLLRLCSAMVPPPFPPPPRSHAGRGSPGQQTPPVPLGPGLSPPNTALAAHLRGTRCTQSQEPPGTGPAPYGEYS